MSWLFTWREGILLIALGILIYLAGALFGVTRKLGRASSVHGSDHSMASMEAEVKSLRARVEVLEEGTANRQEVVDSSVDPLYDTAQRLIKQGLATDEVASRLGLSHAEVDLIAVLHRESGGHAGDPAKM